MLSTSNISAAQAETYYTQDDYYTREATPADACWWGQGAVQLNLTGTVDKDTFAALLHGVGPAGQVLVGKSIDPKKRRAATDFTFSAPKSVSLAALVQQDERVLAAHHQAVKRALTVLEHRYAQTRISQAGKRDRVLTGNLIAAVFTHATSREVEPQLHSHCVVINATQLPDGHWYSFSNEEAIGNQKLLGQIYQNELAIALQQQGHTIEPKLHGQFELAGFSPELLKLFSTRRQQIEQLLLRWELEQPSVSHPSAAQREAATLRSRKHKPKAIARETLTRGWNALIQLKGLQLPTLPKSNLTIPDFAQSLVNTAVETAIQHCSERDAVFRRSQLERFVLEHHLGEFSFDGIQDAIAHSTELIQIDVKNYTTQTALNLELNNIRLMQQGKGQINPMVQPENLELALDKLTAGQQRAISLALTTPDQVIAWQGAAGSGKTAALGVVKAIAQSQGYRVRGFAPSAEAAHILGQTLGIETETVAGRLAMQQSQSALALTPPELWIVDEAGLLSMRAAHDLLHFACAAKVRVLLVGDTRQLSAVEAGNPFKSLQAGGMAIAHLDENLRQQTQHLKAAVDLLASGRAVEAIEQLDDAGCIRGIPNPDERLTELAEDYLKLSPSERQTTLMLAGTNRDRQALTQKIRQGLQKEGALGSDRIIVTGLRQRDLTKAQATYAATFQSGDVLVFQKNYPGQNLVKQQQYTVLEKQVDLNQLTLQTSDGRVLQINPALCQEKTVYEAQQFQMAVGDRLQWTKNNRRAGIRNGQTFTVNQISAAGTAQITDAEGKQQTIHLTGKQYFEHAWVSTTYSSQGKTAERVLALVDGTSQESFYVAVSRARYHLTLYSTDKAELMQLAQKSRAKENASDYVSLIYGVTRHGQTSKADQQFAVSGTTDSNFCERIGGSLCQRIATSPRRTLNPQPKNFSRRAGNPAIEPDFRDLAADLERHLEPLAGAIAEAYQRSELRECLENLTRATEAIDCSVGQMESAIAERTDLTAAINRLNSAVGNYAQRSQSIDPRISDRLRRVALETESKDNPLYKISPIKHSELELPAEVPKQGSKAERFQAMWNQYSQGLQESDLKKLDYQVAKRAFLDGCSPKEIALMLAAGSSFVREQLSCRNDGRSRNKPRIYVSQVARAVCQEKPEQNLRQKQGQHVELS